MGVARRLALALLVVALIAVLWYGTTWLVAKYERFTIEQTRPVVSQVDGMSYRVHEGHASPQAAADTLATINTRVVDLMRFLRARYVRGPAGVRHPARKAAVERLLARYNPDNLAENSPNDPTKDTAYTLDKGSLVAICIRSRAPGSHTIHDIGTLTFVTLHEMAHIAVDVVDHPPQFWRTFRFLLEEAEDAQVYSSPQYAAQPATYCGVTIDYNPRFDPATQPI